MRSVLEQRGRGETVWGEGDSGAAAMGGNSLGEGEEEEAAVSTGGKGSIRTRF